MTESNNTISNEHSIATSNDFIFYDYKYVKLASTLFISLAWPEPFAQGVID